MTTGERIAIWPILTAFATSCAILIGIVLWRGSFTALGTIALAPLAVLVLWILIRGRWLRMQVDALPRYLTSRRVHVILAEANEMQSTLNRLKTSWNWAWAKEGAFHENMVNLHPAVARARSTGLYALRTRRPERIHKGRLQDALRVHRDLRRHLVLSLAQEVESREQRHARDLAALRERGLCTFDAGAGLSKELRWLDVNARVKRIRDEQLLALKEASSALQNAGGEAVAMLRFAQERQRVGDFEGAIQALLRLRPRAPDVAPAPQVPSPPNPPLPPAPIAPVQPPGLPPATDPSPPTRASRQRRKGDVL